MEWVSDIGIWGSFLSLTALEIILGIDNVIFIALVINHLPPTQREKARIIGLSLAWIMRILLLLSVAWIIGLDEPFISIYNFDFSGKDLLLLGGGLFLIYKATSSIHEEIEGEAKKTIKNFTGGFMVVIFQIVIIDLVFSFDSVITAIGITENFWIIVSAMAVAMLVMLLSATWVSDFIMNHPTLKMLALAFILMIGVLLVAESFGTHLPKGYIYFGMAFAIFIEILNHLVRKKRHK